MTEEEYLRELIANLNRDHQKQIQPFVDSLAAIEARKQPSHVILSRFGTPVIRCSVCTNRGKIDGLSQESYCEHCMWQENWRVDHFVENNNAT